MFKARYLLSAALAPAVLLFFYIRKKDKVEPEPMKLLLQLAGLGALSIIPAVIFELVMAIPFAMIFGEDSPIYAFCDCFFVIAVAEEGCKFAMLLLRTWKSKEFNYTYDAVVYAVSVSLGFAALENILYVFQGGFGVALLRALTSVPGHTIFAIYMGYYYGVAKKAACAKKLPLTIAGFAISLILPILIHGFYDFCLSVGSWLFIIIFLLFDVAITVLAFLTVNRLSREDSPVTPYTYV
ncbi:MAG: PrsW family glutamic-type intramembrane protease [Ruminococcus sp.]|nr:PrsW family glutamic-type intramembrane protease [Ruminococcus sp.]